MCVNYIPSRKEQLAQFRVDGSMLGDYKPETWQDYAAPIIRQDEQQPDLVLASYSLIPKSQLPAGSKRYSTMNARAETIGQLRSYARPWRNCQLCLVPMQAFFEPCYESGRAVRYRIGLKDEADFAVAGLYQEWVDASGVSSFSFTQITINADRHPLMNRMHKPGDEKRSLVIIRPEDYDDWLSCKNPEFARTFLQLYPAGLMHAEPADDEKEIGGASKQASLF